MSEVVKVILKDKIANKLVALKLKQQNKIGRAILVLKKKYEHLKDLELALYYKNEELDLNMNVQQFITDYNYTEKKRIEIRQVTAAVEMESNNDFAAQSIAEPASPIAPEKQANDYISMMGQGKDSFSRAVLELLTSAGMINSDINDILIKVNQLNQSVSQVLVDGRYISEQDYLTTIGNKLDIQTMNVNHLDIPSDILNKINKDVAEHCCVLPIKEEGGILFVAVPNPFDVSILQEIRSLVKQQIETILSTEKSIQQRIEKLYSKKEEKIIIENGRRVSSEELSMDKCDAPTVWQDKDDFFADDEPQKPEGQIWDAPTLVSRSGEEASPGLVEEEPFDLHEEAAFSGMDELLKSANQEEGLEISGAEPVTIDNNESNEFSLGEDIPAGVDLEENMLDNFTSGSDDGIAISGSIENENISDGISIDSSEDLNSELSLNNSNDFANLDENNSSESGLSDLNSDSADNLEGDFANLSNSIPVNDDSENNFEDLDSGISVEASGALDNFEDGSQNLDEGFSIESENSDIENSPESNVVDENNTSNSDSQDEFSIENFDNNNESESSENEIGTEAEVEAKAEVEAEEPSALENENESEDNTHTEPLVEENEDENLSIGEEIPLYGGINPEELEQDSKEEIAIKSEADIEVTKTETEEEAEAKVPAKPEDPEMNLTHEEEELEQSIRSEFLESRHAQAESVENEDSQVVESNQPVQEQNEQHTTESQDSTLPEAQTIEPQEIEAAPPQPVMKKAPAPKKTKTIQRNINISHYKKVSLMSTYPINIAFSKEKITKEIVENIKQVQGKISISASNPIVKIIPHIPGCIVSAQEIYVDVSGKVKAQVWITPISPGKIQDAYIQFWHENKCISQMNLDFKVVKQSTAKFSIACAFIFPVISFIYSIFGQQILEKSPGVMRFALQKIEDFAHQTNGIFNLGLIVGLSFLGLSSLFYLINRHKKALPVSQKLELTY